MSDLANSNLVWSGTLLDVAKSGGTLWSVQLVHLISRGRQPRAHVCATIQRTRPPSTQSTVGWPMLAVSRGTEPSRYPAGTVGCTLGEVHGLAVHHNLPTLPKARHGELPGSEQNRMGPLAPLPKPVVCAMIDWERAAALAVAWDAILRDLIAMRTDSLMEPGQNTQHRWALLFYAVEIQRVKQDTRLRHRGDSQTPCGNDAGPRSALASRSC